MWRAGGGGRADGGRRVVLWLLALVWLLLGVLRSMFIITLCHELGQLIMHVQPTVHLAGEDGAGLNSVDSAASTDAGISY